MWDREGEEVTETYFRCYQNICKWRIRWLWVDGWMGSSKDGDTSLMGSKDRRISDWWIGVILGSKMKTIVIPLWRYPDVAWNFKALMCFLWYMVSIFSDGLKYVLALWIFFTAMNGLLFGKGHCDSRSSGGLWVLWVSWQKFVLVGGITSLMIGRHDAERFVFGKMRLSSRLFAYI